MVGRNDRLAHLLLVGLSLCAVLLAMPSALSLEQLPQGSAAASRPAAPLIIEINLNGAVMPLPAEFVIGGIDEAARRGASLVLITMNTPGGLDDSMRSIIQRIISSTVPVVVFVAPAGSRAASAGFFILLSADVAAMAPGTATGASTPIFVIGGSPVNIDETLRRKATNDASAYLRSIAAKRGRNVELAEKAVTEAKAFSEKEALEGKLIDLVAANTDELLASLEGRNVTLFNGRRVTLAVKGAVRERVTMTARQRWLGRIAQPDILFILLIVGVLGIYAEFSHPGLIVPGAIGVIALVLMLVGVQVLPVSALGVLLILMALGLFILEAKYTSHGLLGITGAVVMILGALFLIRSPLTGAGVSLGTALGVTVPFAVVAIFLMRLVLRSFQWKLSTGIEELIGKVAEVTEPIPGGPTGGAARAGMVFVHGELWRAVATEQVQKGARVRIVRVEGLTLHVKPVE